MNKHTNLFPAIITILFTLFVVAMGLLYLATPDKTFSQSENRMLEQRPRLSRSDLLEGKLSSDYEKYLSDQFPMRDFWIGVKSDSERILGKKENNGVYLGQEGHLFQQCSKADPHNIQAKLDAINTFVGRESDVKTYFSLIPNASAILNDKLPTYAPVEDEETHINQIVQGLDPAIRYINIYDTLCAKKNEAIFYKTDHHWTSQGAYYAYQETAKEMGFTAHNADYFQIKQVTDCFYGSLYSKGGFRHLEPDTIELYYPRGTESYTVDYYDYQKSSDSLYFMDNLYKKDKYTVFLNGNQSLIKISTGVNNDRKLLLIKDSFANSLIPFLAGHYNEIYVVDLRFYSDNLSELVKNNAINEALILYSINTFFE